MGLDASSFSDAKRGEDQVEDVVGGGGAGDFVELAEGAVEVEQEHFVRGVALDRVGGGGKSGERVLDQLLLAEVGEERGLLLGGAAGDLHYFLPQLGDSLSGQSGGLDHLFRNNLSWWQCLRHYTVRLVVQISLVQHQDSRPALSAFLQFEIAVAQGEQIENNQNNIRVAEPAPANPEPGAAPGLSLGLIPPGYEARVDTRHPPIF